MAVGRAPADLDLGSLGAFLNAGGSQGNAAAAARFSQLPQRHGKGTSGASNAPVPGMGLPMRPQQQPFQDSAGLNRKVAFKMLKQLGCQVQAVEPEDDEHGGAGSVEAFIEVRQHTQPVLFQMLLEFGYHPFLTVDSATAIRVEQPRQRAREQVFAALAAPRPPRLPEQLPADVVKLKMSMQDEQDSVRRLSERRATKAEEAATSAPRDKEPKKYRSAAEQKTALDRLIRPRDFREADSCDSILLPPPASASTSCLSRGVTWPRPVIRPRASSTGAEPKTVRPSPRLAQAGTFALRTPGSSSGHSPVDYSDTPALDRQTVASPLPLAMLCSSLEALGLAETACDTQPVLATEAMAPPADIAVVAPASDAATIEVPEAGVLAPALDVAVAVALECGPTEHRGTIGTASLAAEPEPQLPESLIDSLQSLSHIDSVLGPLAWPGRPSATRSQAEQQDRAKRLARPRVPQTPQDTQPTPAPAQKRSSLAQRDACSRLAVPRAPAVQKAEPSCGSDGVAEIPVGVDERGPLQEGSASMEPQEVGQARVVVIPSMLSQLGLGRIDEHAPAAGSVKGPEGRRRQRASSVPPAAAPYAVPVVPGLKTGSGDSSSSSRSGDSSSSNSSGLGSRRHPRSRSAHQPREAHSEKAASSLEQLLNDPRLVAEVVQEEIDENGEEGGEAMLAHIDRLYNSLLHQQAPVSGASHSLPGVGEMCDSSASSPGPNAAGSSQGSAVFRMLETNARHGVDDMPPTKRQDATERRDVKRPPRATGRSAMQLLEDARNQALGQDSNEAQTPTRPHAEDDDDGEGLIANIDQLYNDLMQGDSQNEAAAVDEQVRETAASAATEEPANALPLPTAGGTDSRELLGLLEEVLWSALLLKRSSGGGLDVQANLLELLPPHDLAQCFVACGSDSLASSLLQRLSVELPGIHTALVCMSPRLSGSCRQSMALLAANVRKARDQLLILASTSSACNTPSSSVPPPAPSTASCTLAALSKERAALEALESARSFSTEPGRRRPKPRKSSMSHWTADSLDSMEAPPRRLSQRAK